MTKIFDDFTYVPEIHGVIPASELKVTINGKTLLLSDIKFGKEASDVTQVNAQNIKSYRQFMELRNSEGHELYFFIPHIKEDGTLDYSNPHNKISVNNSSIDFYIEPKMFEDTVNKYESYSVLPEDNTGRPTAEAQEVAVGTKRTVKMKGLRGESTNNNYVLVKLSGREKPIFLKKQQIAYATDENEYTYLHAQGLGILGAVDINFYATQKGVVRPIEWMQTSVEYVPTKLLDYYTVDTDHMQQLHITLDENGAEKERKVISNIEKFYSVHTPITVTEPNPKKPSETIETKKIKIQNYKAGKVGDYIKVKPKNYESEILVKVSDLLTSAKKPLEQEVDKYIGRKTFVKLENETVELEPLTEVQTKIKYSSVYAYNPTEDVKDINGENTFLRLRNGKYIKEKEVATKPMCYNFVGDNERHDAYVVLSADGATHIVPYNAFDKKDVIYSDSKNPVALHKSAAKPVRRTVDYANCDVIQTTSQNKRTERCEVLKGLDYDLGVEAQAKVRQEQEMAFLEAYKNGNYKLSEVVIDGKIERLETKAKRYVYGDSYIEDDYASQTQLYLGSKYRPLQMNINEKGGMKVALEGGPKYDVGKGIKSMYKKWGNAMLQYSQFMLSGAGLIAAFVAPAVVVASAVVMAATPVLIPAINAGIGLVANRKTHVWKDKTLTRRKHKEKELIKDLKYVKEGIAEKFAKYDTLLDASLRDRFENNMLILERKLMSLGTTQFNAKFKFDGKTAKIDENNAHIATKFRKEVLAMENAKKKLTSRAEKEQKKLESLTTKLETENKNSKKYQKLQAEYDKQAEVYRNAVAKQKECETKLVERKEFLSRGSQVKANSKFQELTQRISDFKGFARVKYFGDYKCETAEISLEQNKILTKLDFDIKKGFTYDGKPVDMSKTDSDVVKLVNTIKEFGLSTTDPRTMQREVQAEVVAPVEQTIPVQQENVTQAKKQATAEKPSKKSKFEVVDEFWAKNTEAPKPVKQEKPTAEQKTEQPKVEETTDANVKPVEEQKPVEEHKPVEQIEEQPIEEKAEQTEEPEKVENSKLETLVEQAENYNQKFERKGTLKVDKKSVNLICNAVKKYMSLSKEISNYREEGGEVTPEQRKTLKTLKRHIRDNMQILSEVHNSWQTNGNQEYEWLDEQLFVKVNDVVFDHAKFNIKAGGQKNIDNLTKE